MLLRKRLQKIKKIINLGVPRKIARRNAKVDGLCFWCGEKLLEDSYFCGEICENKHLDYCILDYDGT